MIANLTGSFASMYMILEQVVPPEDFLRTCSSCLTLLAVIDTVKCIRYVPAWLIVITLAPVAWSACKAFKDIKYFIFEGLKSYRNVIIIFGCSRLWWLSTCPGERFKLSSVPSASKATIGIRNYFIVSCSIICYSGLQSAVQEWRVPYRLFHK